MRKTTTATLAMAAAAVGLAHWATAPGWAHGDREPHQRPGVTPAGARYQLTKHWAEGEVRVVDRRTGRLFCLNRRRGEALMIDAIAGTCTTKVIERTTRPMVKRAAPPWPKRDVATKGAARFVGLGADNPKALTLEDGVTPAVFDADTGRIYRVLSPVEIEVVDAVEGKITRQRLQLNDNTMLTLRMQMARNELQLLSALQILSRAQLRFRDGDLDKDGKRDFATLKELGALKLISPELAAGKYGGYTVTLRLGTGGAVYLVAASPVEVGKTGLRHFAISERGVPYARTRAIPLGPDCRIPDDATKVDRLPHDH